MCGRCDAQCLAKAPAAKAGARSLLGDLEAGREGEAAEAVTKRRRGHRQARISAVTPAHGSTESRALSVKVGAFVNGPLSLQTCEYAPALRSLNAPPLSRVNGCSAPAVSVTEVSAIGF